MKKDKYTYIDLFAGCGGLSLGLYNSRQWKGLFAIEKDSMAFQTLKYNLIDQHNHFDWPSWLPCQNHEIDKVLLNYKEELTKLKGKVDLVVGGPPCQGFSSAGRREEKDKRNTLVYSYLEFIDTIRPRMIFFENVKGFDVGFLNNSAERGIAYSRLVTERLKEIGYTDACYNILDFSEFGIPQRRQRVIIVASLNGKIDNSFFESIKDESIKLLKTKKLPVNPTIEDAISDLEEKYGKVDSPDSNGFKAGLYKTNNLTKYQKYMRSDGEKNLPDSHRFVKHRQNVTDKFNQIIKDELTSKAIQQKYHTKKHTTQLLKRNLPSPTLTTLPDDFIHYSEPRILTVREYARIQSFPDWYEFKGKYTTGGCMRKHEVPRYTQIGNAIPPLFGELSGIVISLFLER